jgi:hypothetical protein
VGVVEWMLGLEHAGDELASWDGGRGSGERRLLETRPALRLVQAVEPALFQVLICATRRQTRSFRLPRHEHGNEQLQDDVQLTSLR